MNQKTNSPSSNNNSNNNSKNSSIYDIEVTDINHNRYTLRKYEGKVLIIVNVASKCGLANQSYQELTSLLVKYHSKGLRILLFPCKQFLNQEFDEMEKVQEFAKNYSENFIIMDAVNVKGHNIHPLFKYLTEHLKGFITNEIKWNFTYFLVGRNGELVRRYGPTERLPDTDPDLLSCIGDVEHSIENTRSAGKIKVDFDDDSSN